MLRKADSLQKNTAIEMKVIEEIEEMRRFSRDARIKGRKIALVPTMGFIHEGHTSLIGKAKTLADTVVLSVFVNPAQFGPGEDYKTYPRDIKKDMAISEKEGVDIFFSPIAEEMYQQGYSTFIDVEGLSEKLCGIARPTHFIGVATVVVKLFNIVSPDVSIFGLKDYQQQIIIKKLVRDLNMGVEIVIAETVRDADGVAMSSRNKHLSSEERKAASCIPRSFEAARKAFLDGERKGANIVEKVKKIMEKEPLVMVDYIKVCDPETLSDIERIEGRGVLAVALNIGGARLIDNLMLG